MAKATLVMLTGSYPYSGAAETTFVGPELEFLVKRFDEVVLAPETLGGAPLGLPDGARLDPSYAGALGYLAARRPTWSAALASGLLPREMLSQPSIWLSARTLRRLLAFAARAETARRWVVEFLRVRDGGPVLFYSYWLGASTMGAILAGQRVVSRAHNVDLYEARHTPPYLPCRARLLSGLTRLFLISEDGRQHMSRRFPHAASRCEVMRLGVQEPESLAQPSTDGVTRIVSCSAAISVKRLDRLVSGLRRAAEQRPQRQLEWTHFGEGPLLGEIKEQLRGAPANLEWRLDGWVSNAEVLASYRGRPVDVFINMSEFEGLPVSVMEALAHGIPAIAPDVGGNADVVSAQTGVLLPASPGTEDVANAILSVVDAPEVFAQKRASARDCAARLVSAATNYRVFADRLLAIATSTETPS